MTEDEIDDHLNSIYNYSPPVGVKDFVNSLDERIESLKGYEGAFRSTQILSLATLVFDTFVQLTDVEAK